MIRDFHPGPRFFPPGYRLLDPDPQECYTYSPAVIRTNKRRELYLFIAYVLQPTEIQDHVCNYNSMLYNVAVVLPYVLDSES